MHREKERKQTLSRCNTNKYQTIFMSGLLCLSMHFSFSYFSFLCQEKRVCDCLLPMCAISHAAGNLATRESVEHTSKHI